MTISGRLPKAARSESLADPFLIVPSDGDGMTLADLIRYGLARADDFPIGYCGPLTENDPRFHECERRHRAR